MNYSFRLKEWISLGLWIIGFELIGIILGWITQANIVTWYAGLNKSSLTPPGYVFSIVWTILYAILAIIAWNLSKLSTQHEFKTIVNLFIAHMLMNWSWSIIFFKFHWIGLSFLWLIAMVIISGLLLYLMQKKLKHLAILFMPNFFWLVFASYLNGVTWLLN